MKIIQGKYNKAHIMIDEIDQSTHEQIQEMMNHPAFADTYIAIMPDCHAGNGAVIGFTAKLNNYIIPNIVGVDIGCGMLSAKFYLEKRFDLKLFDEFIKQNIPCGFNVNKSISEIDKQLIADINAVCEVIDIDPEKAMKAIGSLGGGNHFIEAGEDSNKNIWITIHSGSRNFGLKVANYYQNLAKENLSKYFISNQYKNLEFLLTNSDEGQEYLCDMRIAQRFSSANRKEMMKRIISFFDIEPSETIESIHNFIGDDNIIRKGATSARIGEKLIIPFNMKDGLIIGRGKGCHKYNNSAPHGAGRILSRKQAKLQLNAENFIQEMANAEIYTTTATIETLDEAPNAYKDKNIILENIKDTIEILEFVKPFYNFKAIE